MSRRTRKKRRRKRPTPNLPPLALLRPRLDGLLGNEALAKKDTQALKADLNAVFRRLKPSEFLPVFLSACSSAPVQVQARKDFDALKRSGRSPESLSHFEQTVGRRVRLEDGKELLVVGSPFDEDEW